MDPDRERTGSIFILGKYYGLLFFLLFTVS